jgi:hypothetical protein
MDMAVEAREPSKMQVLAATYTDLFGKVADAHPELAAAALAMLAPIEYNNYVTPEEAMAVASKFVNDDTKISGATTPSKGAHWPTDVLKSFLSSRNIPLEEKPYYNWPALWLTVNMIYSDYADTLSELLGTKDNERLATAVYKMAVKKLKDLDRPSFIRSYFGL